MRKLEIILLLFILTISCANPGVPSGGDLDEEAPKITNTKPENYTINFDNEKIIIDFNEFVKVENAAQNVIISPPQKKKPRVREKGKQIVVELKDSLLDNTTYTIDFGKAIVDNNEGNELGEYRYVFSTGDQIDEMGLAGYVKGAKVDTISEGAIVALYIPNDTLDVYNNLPNYIAKTDTLGFFMFNNISDTEYHIIAFQDENGNNMLDPNEPLAFKEESIDPSVSLSGDSIQLDKYTIYNNTNLLLRLFKPTIKQQYLVDYSRPLREKIILNFNAPRNDSLQMEFINVEDEATFFIESNEQNDSLIYWIADEDVYKEETLIAELKYKKTDSTGNLITSNDTIKLNYKPEKKETKKPRKDKDKPEVDFLKIQTNMSGKVHKFEDLFIKFERPVKELTDSIISIYYMNDTIKKPIDFTLTKDSILAHRKYLVELTLETAREYNLEIDSAQVFDSSNRTNNKFESRFSVYDESYYGKLFVSVKGGDENVWIQLTSKSDPNTIIAQKKWIKDEIIRFEHLPPGSYKLMALWDSNDNGKWDTGDYENLSQPETIQIFSKDIELRSNWEQEVNWTLKNNINEN